MKRKRDYFNELAPGWDAMPRPPDAEERIAAFCRRGCPETARRVLDVGSGTGLLGPHLGGKAMLVEMDFALEMLRLSRKKWDGGFAHRVCADAAAPPFRPASFDAVLCFGILPHLADARGALEKLWRLTRQNGTLAIGHLMGSAQLNERHRSIGGPVGDDTLLPAQDAARILEGMGATEVEAEDVPERYFVLAKKGDR